MNAIQKSASLVLCLALCACGNKGNLYLEPIDLTDEQKALLVDLDGKKKKTESTESAQ